MTVMYVNKIMKSEENRNKELNRRQAKKLASVYHYGTLSMWCDLLAPPFVDSAIEKKKKVKRLIDYF